MVANFRESDAMQILRYYAEGRKATWLELFFDLVFVAAIGQITHTLAHTHDGHLAPDVWWKLPTIFLPIWWVWAGHTVYANRFDADGQLHRLVSLVIMLLALVLAALATVDDWERFHRIYMGCYFVIRAILSGLYFHSRNAHDGNARLAVRMGTGTLVCAAISLSAVWFPPSLRYGVFYAGIVVEMLLPLCWRRDRASVPVHGEHMVERVGLLTIILLGESVITLANGLSEVQWDPMILLAALSGFIMVGSIWWIYFDRLGRLADRQDSATGLVLLYSNLLTCLGLVVLANLIHHAIHPGLARREYQIMAVAGMALFYIGKQCTFFYRFKRSRKVLACNTTAVFLLSGLSLLLPENIWILLGLTLTMLLYVGLNYFTRKKFPMLFDSNGNDSGAVEPHPVG
jgi:low temperature requirement protein LtrA